VALFTFGERYYGHSVAARPVEAKKGSATEGCCGEGSAAAFSCRTDAAEEKRHIIQTVEGSRTIDFGAERRSVATVCNTYLLVDDFLRTQNRRFCL
jgi:hypothetical protein